MTTSRPTRPLRRLLVDAALVGSLAAGLGGLAAPAHASGGDDDRVTRSGACTGPGAARWKLKAKTDDGRLEVEGEVDSNRAGQTWTWTLRNDGAVVARGTSRTAGRSGSFSVERHVRNTAGRDALVFRATRGSSGEVCIGRLTF